MRGQISAEMVILLVIIIAVVALVASNLFSGAKQASESFKGKVEDITQNINESCFTDIDCEDLGPGYVCKSGRCAQE